MTLSKIHKHLAALITGIAISISLTGCDLVNDDSDCVSSYNIVKLEYSHNMKFADAFDSEVEYVSLLVFDSGTGLLKTRINAGRDLLGDNHELTLDVEPGDYDLLVWGGHHYKNFDIPEGVIGETTLTQMRSILRHLDEGDSDKGHIRDEIASLFHGLVHVSLPYASPSKPNRVTVPLKKDTNTIRVVLQHISGDPVKDSDYDITITDSNGSLEHDNEITAGYINTEYHPWYTFSGSVDVNTNPTDAPGSRAATPATRNAFSATLAEFTVNRLHINQKPMLKVVHKATGKVVFNININDYALLVKGFYNTRMDDQEYLDRQDEYNMTFFLDEGNRWFSTTIIINDWRIVRNETPIQ